MAKLKRKLTAEAVVFDEAGRVLLVKQGCRGRGWELPGGGIKKGESPSEAVAREVFEETGVHVTARELLGVFHIPEGAKREYYDFVFLCALDTPGIVPEPRPHPPETEDARFWPPDELPAPIQAFTIDRIAQGRNGTRLTMPMTLDAARWLD